MSAQGIQVLGILCRRGQLEARRSRASGRLARPDPREACLRFGGAFFSFSWRHPKARAGDGDRGTSS